MLRPSRVATLVVAWMALLGSATAAEPAWIWSPPSEDGTTPGEVWFRREFRTPPYTWNARLTVAADDRAEVFLNGKPVAATTGPDQPVRAEVSVNLIQGTNVLAVRAVNATGRAGLLVHLNLGGSETRQVVSDAQWWTSTRAVEGWSQLGPDPAGGRPATVVAAHGEAPWGEVLDRAIATPADQIRVADGFRVELLRSATPEEGSWVAMAFGHDGRLLISPEGERRPLLRLTLTDGRVAQVEPLAAPVRFAMGLLFAHDSLYANALGPSGSGLYRLTDRNGDGGYEKSEVVLLKEFKGGGEHGYHALRSGPDGSIYVLNGNVTKPPAGLSRRSPYRNYAEDVLSLNPDETTRAGGALVPGGQLLRTDADGREWSLVAGGLRNAYDFDVGPEGEIFTFDSDNEWDWGTPWYRATRIYHLTSGTEVGWRDGTRAWPDHYPDLVLPVVDIGIGSPCGVRFGTRSHFPERYRRALFVQDWSYGRILVVDLEPQGSTFRGTFEEFLRGQPLNLTAMEFGPDGALYFITGGRGTQSGLYRVSAATPAPPTTGDGPHLPGREARELRRSLEALHGAPTEGAVDRVWPHLASPDARVRFAARVALEAQPVRSWRDRALGETNVTLALHALLALSRSGSAQDAAPLVEALGRWDAATLSEADRLVRLRVFQLAALRLGPWTTDVRAAARQQLEPAFPAARWAENRELSRLLLFLESPGAVERTLKLLAEAAFQEHQLHYVSQLRHAREGWTAAGREQYLRWWLEPRDHLQRPGSLLHWFHDVGREYVDGAGLDRHLEGFRRDAVAALPESERERLAEWIRPPMAGAQLVPPQPRQEVKAWTTAELLPLLDQVSQGRNFERGRRAFIDTQCYACHRLGNTGGAAGPELSGIGLKYSRRDLLETLIEPSKVISEQYQNLRVFLRDGEEHTGRLVRESAEALVLETDPLTRQEQVVKRSDVEEIRPSAVSPMPEGLLNVLTAEEILDLLAFLENAGRADAPAFRSPPKP